MMAKFFEASLLGLMIGSALAIAGVDFALILGLIAAVTNIIPYVEPVFGLGSGACDCSRKIRSWKFVLYCVFYLSRR